MIKSVKYRSSATRDSDINRSRETGYGSAIFLRACVAAAACREIEGRGLRAAWLRVRAGSLHLLWYRFNLPATRVRLTASPAGRMIGEHLAVRNQDGRWRYRRAQGVLPLPAEFSQYLRGRRRQAVRTNVGHARDAGLTVSSCTIDYWLPGPDDTRSGHISMGPIERWTVLDPDGALVADSVLSVDEEVALLHGLVSSTPYARWLLHTAIVERLSGHCRVLLTNSDDAYTMSPGAQHFQRLLGYEIARLRLPRSPLPLPQLDAAVPPPLTEIDLQKEPALSLAE